MHGSSQSSTPRPGMRTRRRSRGTRTTRSPRPCARRRPVLSGGHSPPRRCVHGSLVLRFLAKLLFFPRVTLSPAVSPYFGGVAATYWLARAHISPCTLPPCSLPPSPTARRGDLEAEEEAQLCTEEVCRQSIKRMGPTEPPPLLLSLGCLYFCLVCSSGLRAARVYSYDTPIILLHLKKFICL